MRTCRKHCLYAILLFYFSIFHFTLPHDAYRKGKMTSEKQKEFHKKYTGNTILYLDTQVHRAPVILQRSIDTFLRHSRRQITKRRNRVDLNRHTRKPNEIDFISMETQRGRNRWSIKNLERALKDASPTRHLPSLKVEVKGLRDRRERENAWKLAQNPDGGPPTKRLKTTEFKAKCALTIWHSRPPKKDLIQQTKSCVIRVIWSEYPEATVHMDEPFVISLQDLLIGQGSGNVGEKHIDDSYVMQIALTSSNSSECWPPIPLKLPIPQTPQILEDGDLVRFPFLTAKWLKLPECVPPDYLLDIFAFQDLKTYKTKLAMEVEASWGVRTPLAVQNAIIRRDPSPLTHLPTPSSEAEIFQSIIDVRWSVGGFWATEDMGEVVVDSYDCLLCKRPNFDSFEAYHFHLINSHDQFKFKLLCEATTSPDGRPRMNVEVKVEIADTYRQKATSNAPDDRELKWERPRSFFDLEAFVRGDESWLGKLATNRNPKLLAIPQTQDKSNLRENVRGGRPTVEIRAPEVVPNLDFPNRRRHKVPPAPPNVSYFRSTVKRPLKEGEWLTESDDEIDESWVLQKHEDALKTLQSMTKTEKEFISKYDSHVLQENLSGNIHLNDALVRFCRLNGNWLKRKDIKREFQKVTTVLILHQVIKPSTVRGCMNIINQSVETCPESDGMEGMEESQSRIEDPIQSSLRRKRKPRSPVSTETENIYGQCPHCRSKIYSMQTATRCSRPVYIYSFMFQIIF